MRPSNIRSGKPPRTAVSDVAVANGIADPRAATNPHYPHLGSSALGTQLPADTRISASRRGTEGCCQSDDNGQGGQCKYCILNYHLESFMMIRKYCKTPHAKKKRGGGESPKIEYFSMLYEKLLALDRSMKSW